MAKRILLIVEGEADEVRFVRRLFTTCQKTTEYEIYPYKTNIHVLAQELYNNYPDFEEDNINIRLVLQSLEDDRNRRRILQNNYTDVYMIFDFEPQHNMPHFDTVKRMLNYFDDPTYQGKLYINYPMMQSYKHFSTLPDMAFYDKVVGIDQVSKYKQMVAKESNYTDVTKYDYKVFYSLAVHHIKKAYYMLNGEFALPTYNQYLDMDSVDLFDKQVSMLESHSNVFVLNTCIFILSDFAPKRFFNFIKNHSSDLLL